MVRISRGRTNLGKCVEFDPPVYHQDAYEVDVVEAPSDEEEEQIEQEEQENNK
jgi:hypothetical protein